MTYVALVLATVTSGPLALHADSPTTVVPLLELFTSEGCSSCPPADAYLSALGSHEDALSNVVPLSFHVTYWDYLGWRDRFGAHRFDDRQKAYAGRPKAEPMYTPQLIVQGDRTQATSLGLDVHLRERAKATASVRIALDATWDARIRELSVVATARPLPEHTLAASALYVALFERHLETPVGRGENQGRRLRHDFVVRRLLAGAPLEADGITVRFTTEIPRDWKPRDIGVAAFVQESESLAVLQSLALTLSPGH